MDFLHQLNVFQVDYTNNLTDSLLYLYFLTADEVQFVYAKEATEEQKRKARELKLPLNFFLYENAPPCPGCRGCEPEESDEPAKPAAVVVPKPIPVTKADTPISFTKMAESSVSQISFSSLVSANSSGFNKPAAFSWSGTGAPIFGVSSSPINFLGIVLLISHSFLGW